MSEKLIKRRRYKSQFNATVLSLQFKKKLATLKAQLSILCAVKQPSVF